MVIDYNKFIYGIKFFIINKETLETEFKGIEKPQPNESPSDFIARILTEYNIKDFTLKPQKGFGLLALENSLINKGFHKYAF